MSRRSGGLFSGDPDPPTSLIEKNLSLEQPIIGNRDRRQTLAELSPRPAPMSPNRCHIVAGAALVTSSLAEMAFLAGLDWADSDRQT